MLPIGMLEPGNMDGTPRHRMNLYDDGQTSTQDRAR